MPPEAACVQNVRCSSTHAGGDGAVRAPDCRVLQVQVPASAGSGRRPPGSGRHS